MTTLQTTHQARDASISVNEGPRLRPAWAEASDEMRAYYDNEWGRVTTDERGMFEALSLEVFQVGLSWRTVLQRRTVLRTAFHGFSPQRVAALEQADVTRLLGDHRMIRNRRKIEATISNARITCQMAESDGPSLSQLVWSFMPVQSPVFAFGAALPRVSPESTALARELKRRGFLFVGPASTFALMAATGVIDAHDVDSPLRGCSGLWNVDGTRSAASSLMLAGAVS